MKAKIIPGIGLELDGGDLGVKDKTESRAVCLFFWGSSDETTAGKGNSSYFENCRLGVSRIETI